MPHTIEVILSPALFEIRHTSDAFVGVGVDVLRATTSLCAMLHSGVSQVVLMHDLNQMELYRRRGYTIAAERMGQRVEGATYGNSPTQYLATDLHGIRMAYSTSNGTHCLLTLSGKANKVYAGAFANISALCQYLQESMQNVVVLCSGWHDTPCLEDSLLAGMIVQRMVANGDYQALGDSTVICQQMWQQCHNRPYIYCSQASHVQRLQRIGVEEDIRFAFRSDTCPIVPELISDIVVPAP